MIGYSYSTNHSSTNTLTMSKKKPPRQLKQRYYYIFWSIATIAVVSGQIHVATAYNRMASNLELIFDTSLKK